MNLLQRIAYSNGDPQRTIRALRLINERLADEAKQALSCSEVEQLVFGLDKVEKRAAEPKATKQLLLI